MKNYLLYFLFFSALFACKKGQDDPVFSLRSRKSRLSGDWIVSSSENNYTLTKTTNMPSGNYIETTTVSENFVDLIYTKNHEWSTTQTGDGIKKQTITESGSVISYLYSFNKEGTWTSKREYKVISYKYINEFVYSGAEVIESGDLYNQNGTSIIVNLKEEANGSWQFASKNKNADLKNKESVILSYLNNDLTVSTSTTDALGTVLKTDIYKSAYALNELTMVWHLTLLKNKEIKADLINNNKTGGSHTNNGNATTDTDIAKKGTLSINLTQN